MSNQQILSLSAWRGEELGNGWESEKEKFG